MSGTTAARRIQTGRGAPLLVAAGILLSRLSGCGDSGLRALFGNGAAADAYTARCASRRPAKSIGRGGPVGLVHPVYASLRAGARRRGSKSPEPWRAWSAWQRLFAVAGILPRLVIDLSRPASRGDAAARIQLVENLLSGVSLLVLSAYCLGSSSHRKFFLSYAARSSGTRPIVAAWSWAARAGSWGRSPGHRARLGNGRGPARCSSWCSSRRSCSSWAGRARSSARLGLGRGDRTSRQSSQFFPVLMGAAWCRSLLCRHHHRDWLPVGALASMNFAQIVYMLPVLPLRMSISAAALRDERVARVRTRPAPPRCENSCIRAAAHRVSGHPSAGPSSRSAT